MIEYLHFKTDQQTAEWLSGKLSLAVVMLVLHMASLAFARYRKLLTVTEIFKEGITDPSGTHHAHRAVDIRNSNLTREEALELAYDVNDFAVYDPDRPRMLCCLVYDLDPDHRHDDHFHVQVHANTVFRGEISET